MSSSAAPIASDTSATALDPTPWVQRHESAGVARYQLDQAEARLRRGTTGLEVYLAAAPHRLSAALLSAIFCDHPDAAIVRLSGDEPFELHAAGFSARPEADAPCPRAGFFQLPWLWHAAGVHPALPPLPDDAAHPPRPAQPRGTLYQRHDPLLGAQIGFRVIDSDADLECFHAWMNQPRVAHYWEKAWSETALHDYLVELAATPHTFGLIALMDGESFGYFEPYWTLEDRL
ncbi:MAG: acetyltransferase, partial [Nitrococcus sp.]|nr:acetyltransferase [Nitrococcus sp.]